MATRNTTGFERSKYNVETRVEEATQFFRQQLRQLDDSLDRYMLLPMDHTIPRGLAMETSHFLCYLRAIEDHDTPTEMLIAQFVCSTLEATRYEAKATMLMPGGYPTSFAIQGVQKPHTPGFSLLYSDSFVLLVGQTGNGDDNIQDRVILEAIAAFQHNNIRRIKYGRASLPSMVIPCITMVETRPVFYKVPVTQALSDSVQSGEYPKNTTVVLVCRPPEPLGEKVGMENVEYRRVCLQYFDAFLPTAKECWNKFIDGIPPNLPVTK